MARLLRTGAVFKFQVQGVWRPRAERRDTWMGSPVSSKEVLSWLDRYGFDLLHFEGVGTQYQWLWMRKRNDTRQDSRGNTVRDSAVRENARLLTHLKLLEAEIESYARLSEQLSAEREARTRWAETSMRRKACPCRDQAHPPPSWHHPKTPAC